MARNAAYKAAEREIEAARQSGSKKLTLVASQTTGGAGGLFELPESIGELTQLQSLDISGNQLTEIPDALSQLTKLQTLNISGNQLAEIPDALSRLTQLRTLDLSKNQLIEVPKFFGLLTRLLSLDLSGNQLLAISESIGDLVRLQDLNLDNNALVEIPSSFGRLEQLQTLRLANNQLSMLPDAFGELKKLNKLEVDRNQLSRIPESLGQLKELESLDLSCNQLVELPESIGGLLGLRSLFLWRNLLQKLPNSMGNLQSLETLLIPVNLIARFPRSMGKLKNLKSLDLGHYDAIVSETGERLNNLDRSGAVIKRGVRGNKGGRQNAGNPIASFPDWIRGLTQLTSLGLDECRINLLPDWIAELSNLETLHLRGNGLNDIPEGLAEIDSLRYLSLDDNPLNPELAAANDEGLDAVKRYLSAKAEAQVTLNEAKLILVGEGEVGKSCLLGALRCDEWIEGRPTTHGIDIKPVMVVDDVSGSEFTLNGWDFGGQRVYRPTHQLFFSSPAVYLVVWKPREGPQQGFVKEWIKLVKHREPDAKILVVATHGGPDARQPDIDRQEIWDVFGKETVIDFIAVDSKSGHGLDELKAAIAKVAADLPEMDRKVPKSWYDARVALKGLGSAYITTQQAIGICERYNMGVEDARLFLIIEHRLGQLIHYAHDPLLKDVVVLKPDWLATAISFVLDDKETRVSHGLINHDRLASLWDDDRREMEYRYPVELHPVFRKLMERYDLSYRVAEVDVKIGDGASLIAQLVPDMRPESIPAWSPEPRNGDVQQVQICRIVETSNGQSATAEGLFYQLIVRLHKYSLGRRDFRESVHWQRGLLLEDDTGARAFLEHIANDVRITVRSPYPERFLSALTYEAKWLLESFWEGLRCEVTVPCLTAEPGDRRCGGLFDVKDLIDDLRDDRPEQKCLVCKKWHSITQLLHNAPAARPNPIAELLMKSDEALKRLEMIRGQLDMRHIEVIGRFDQVDAQGREIISKVEAAYSSLMYALLDEAKDGPRLFSFEPVEPGFLDKPKWISAKFKLSLWCEHSRAPLWKIASDRNVGVYTIDLPRDWLIKAAPFLKVLTTTLSLVLPVAAAIPKVMLSASDYQMIEGNLALGKATAESLLKGAGKMDDWLSGDEGLESGHGKGIRANGAVLRQLHSWLKEKDVGFGGLVRVMNKRQEFLWVHPIFEGEY